MTSPSSRDSYIIVGAGVFGTSTALHLIQKYPSATVILIDRTPFLCQVGASWDLNKVIRADYTNILYMELASEAMRLWRSDPLYRPFYHESGLVWIGNEGFPQTIVDNYNKLKSSDKCHLYNSEEVKGLWGGIHVDANYDGVTDILVNESSGWAEASKALKRVIETAVEAGVKYIAASIEALVIDNQGSCTGVRTAKGDVMSASHVILATGATTAKLIADSVPDREEMQVRDRLVAAAVCTGIVTLSPEDAKYFSKGPVFVHGVGDTLGGSIPANSENQLKLYLDVSFTNTVTHTASGQKISMPPSREDYAQWDVSPGMKQELELVSKGIFGKKSSNWKIENHRICWDAITPTQDHIICEHPHCKHLYVATGGSFHSWKFLPIVGKYVVQMLEGKLDPKLAKTWAWDREKRGSAHESLMPRREMRDV